jgi:hypothetical protein
MKPDAVNLYTHLSDASRDEIERIVERDRLYREIREDLCCNSRYERFFSHFDDASVHDFIAYYAGRKSEYLLHGESRLHEAESAQLYFRHLAERCFWEIQQKKLFDLQCRWRAGEVALPEIEVSRDFLVQEFAIRSSYLVSPVTKEELQIYIDYLQSDLYTPESHQSRWQDYDYFSTAWRSGEAVFPKWYVFYDEAIGCGDLFSLPDLKGERERKYLRHAPPHRGANSGQNLPAPVKKPELKPDYKTLEFFVYTFEDKSLARVFEATENTTRHRDDDRVEEALQILRLSESPVPMPASGDWRHAVMAAADAFRRKSLIQALYGVFEEYRLRLGAGLAFAESTDEALVEMLRAGVARYKEAILQGRRSLNEPADFGY